ncbi:hypothetical protein [Nocardia sp. NPDC050435]|uniref:hypothetical protein n=1 Tax=Nocardia sp. NPDC050435 TaxID=3155040 RepID=UPI0033E30DBA
MFDPSFRPPELRPDLSNLIVMSAQTGDEWVSTCDLVTAHILPLFAEHRVRFVEVARAGRAQADGIVVLQDTREPVRLHPDPEEYGFYALSAEHRVNGILPTLGGNRVCSAKAKGIPLDSWRAQHLGPRPYLHAVGFNAEETSRVVRDSSITMGGQRTAIYPLVTAGWSRAHCQGYLYGLFGLWWPKSLCRQCCFVSVPSWPEQLARFHANPAEAFKHVVDEYVTLALNPKSGLFGPGKSLTDRLRRGGADQVLALVDAELERCEWAVYRVRRCYSRPATAWRAVETVHRGHRAETALYLQLLAEHLRLPLHHDGTHTRVWLTEASTTYPRLEAFFTAAPAVVSDKRRPGFDTRWHGHADHRLHALEDSACEFQFCAQRAA